MEDEIGKNLGLGKLSPWLSWPGFFGCCHAPRGEAVGATFPHGQICIQELFSDAEIKAVAGLLGWFSFFGGGGGVFVFFWVLTDADIWDIPERSHVAKEVANGRLDELSQ